MFQKTFRQALAALGFVMLLFSAGCSLNNSLSVPFQFSIQSEYAFDVSPVPIGGDASFSVSDTLRLDTTADFRRFQEDMDFVYLEKVIMKMKSFGGNKGAEMDGEFALEGAFERISLPIYNLNLSASMGAIPAQPIEFIVPFHKQDEFSEACIGQEEATLFFLSGTFDEVPASGNFTLEFIFSGEAAVN